MGGNTAVVGTGNGVPTICVGLGGKVETFGKPGVTFGVHKLGLDDESHGEGILCGLRTEVRCGVRSEGEEEHRDEQDLSLWLRNEHEKVPS